MPQSRHGVHGRKRRAFVRQFVVSEEEKSAHVPGEHRHRRRAPDHVQVHRRSRRQPRPLRPFEHSRLSRFCGAARAKFSRMRATRRDYGLLVRESQRGVALSLYGVTSASARVATIFVPLTSTSIASGGLTPVPATISPRTSPLGPVPYWLRSNTVCVQGFTTIGCVAEYL